MRWLVVLAILLAAPRAHADQQYRIVVGATNAVGAGLITIGALTKKIETADRLLLGGLMIMTLAPPLVHVGYDEPERAAISIGAHLVLPLVGGFLGDWKKTHETGLIVGVVAGLVAAAALDVAMASSNDDSASTRMISFGARF
jgi:hypothetical protein